MSATPIDDLPFPDVDDHAADGNGNGHVSTEQLEAELARRREAEELDPLRAARGKLWMYTGGPNGGLTLQRVVRFGEGDAHELHFDGHIVNVGNAAQILQQSYFRAAILGKTKQVMGAIKPADYVDLIRRLVAISEDREGADSDADEAAGWVTDYLHSGSVGNQTYDVDDHKAHGLGAFRGDDGRTYVHADDLAAWLVRWRHSRVTAKEIATRLGRIGFTRKRFDHGKGSARRTRQFRVSPLGWPDRVGDDDQ